MQHFSDYSLDCLCRVLYTERQPMAHKRLVMWLEGQVFGIADFELQAW